MTREPERPICNYEGSAYRTEFWGADRAYEDAVERVAMRHLLPSTGRRLIDIGGGYGRLAPLYEGYDEVILFDYALSQLQQGQALWGAGGIDGKPRYRYVAGDFYALPLASGAFDTVVMVRTLHHAADAPRVLSGISKILAPGGTFVLEFANKRNLKAILRYVIGRQDWSPFDQEPVEFVSLNFDFHPSWIQRQLSNVGLEIERRRAVSSFRLGVLKRLLPTSMLVTLDRLSQASGGFFPLSPSVFVRCTDNANRLAPPEAPLFRCTQCGSESLEKETGRLTCTRCEAVFAVVGGIYDFRTPLQETPDGQG